MAEKLSKHLELEGDEQSSVLTSGQQSGSLKDSESEFFIQQLKEQRVKVSNQKDLVEGRYLIKGNEPLKDFSSSFADAFRIVDQKDPNNTDIYALVMDKRFPINLTQINRIVGEQQEGFCNVLAASLTTLSFKTGKFYVIVVEKPKGITLQQFLSQQGACSEDFIVEKVAPPVNEVLTFLHKRNVMHGHINLQNIYIDDQHRIYVNECVSTICGFYQSSLYETLARSSCLPAGKGEGDYYADYYALGVVVNLMLLGGNPYQKTAEKDIIRLKYTQNTYSMLSRNLQLSPHMLDMLRGTINDNPNEAWDYPHMAEWCKGKRFNLLPQSNRTEATRSIEFNGLNYVNRKHLANDLFLNWNEAKVFVQEDKLSKWVERSVQDSDLAERLELARARAGAQAYAEGFDGGDILLAETILLLDPTGPLRLRNFACSVDGFGGLLAYAYAHGKNEIKHLIRCILSFGLIFGWSNISPQLGETRYQLVLFALQRSADIIDKKGYGFGLERCLYELNPTLCCQSSQVYDETVLSVQRLLQFLNDAKQIEGDLIDKHIAAFVANRVELPSAIRIKSLQNFPDLANNVHIQSLALYALAQQRAEIKKVPGLAEKLQTRLEEIIELFHSKNIREQIYKAIKNPVKDGVLVKVLKVLTNVNYVYRDRSGFRNAKKAYYVKTKHMLNLSNKRAIANVGYRYGLQLALVLSFLIAAITTLTLIVKVF